MATVVRVKRRRNEDPLEVLLLAAKRHKGVGEGSNSGVPVIDKNEFKFAGTVASKEDGISVQVRDAIRKEKLEREYKQHQFRIVGDVRQENRQQFRQKSQQNRLKVTFKHRALELNSLDNIEIWTESTSDKVCPNCGLPLSVDGENDTGKTIELRQQVTTEEIKDNSDKKDKVSANNEPGLVTGGKVDNISKNQDKSTVVKDVKENIKCVGSDKQRRDNTPDETSDYKDKRSNGKEISTDICTCKDRTATKSASIHEKSTKQNKQKNLATTDNDHSNAENGSTGDGPVFCLVDMETDIDTARQPVTSSLTDQITCNSEPMVREFVSEQRDDDYVYDIYYTNSREFDFRLFERDLTFEAFDSDLMIDRAGNNDDDEFVYAEDNDDENAESNWRNDYPDEDPGYYETDRSRYNYETDMTEYEAFETETGNQLADWMSWRCNIDAGELSSDDDECVDHYGDKGSSFDAYYRRVKRETEENDGEDSGKLDIL